MTKAFDPKAYAAKPVPKPAFDPATYGTGDSGAPVVPVGADGPLTVTPGPLHVFERPNISQGTSWARGGSQGLTSNWSDEALGWLASKAPSLNISAERLGEQWQDILAGRVPRPSDAPNLGGYEENRDYFRALNQLAESANPAPYRIGEVTGGVTQAALLGPKPGTDPGPLSFLGAPGAGAGVASGALAGAGGSEAENVEGLATDTARGAAVGGIASTLGPLVGRGVARGAAWLGDLVGLGQGVVRPTPAAQSLTERGVPLTLGQQDPTSMFGQLESVGAGTTLFGPALRRLREQGAEGIQNAAMAEGLPPSMASPPPGMSPQQQQARAYEGFNEAYDQFRDIPVKPYVAEEVPGRVGPGGEPFQAAVNLEAGFQRAAQDPSALATAADREPVERFLQNELTLIPEDAYGPGGRVTFGTLQTLRSNIREKLRQLLSGSSPDYTRAQLLANAEQHVTNVMEAGLSEEQRAALRATDEAYSRHKVLENTLARAGDRPGGFTPYDLEQAVKKGTEKGGFARGTAGGPLRDIAAAGREVLQEPPPTGARLLFGAPGVQNFITGPAALAANTIPAARRAALGQTGWQEVVRDVTSPDGAQQVAGVVAPELLKAAGRSASDRPAPPAETLRRLAANPQAMGAYGHELAMAAAQGDDALVTYDFMKSSTDPEYQRLKRAAAGATTP